VGQQGDGSEPAVIESSAANKVRAGASGAQVGRDRKELDAQNRFHVENIA